MPLRASKKAHRDASGRPAPANFRITFRRDVLAEALWEYGEEELAKAALELSEDGLHQVQLPAAHHHLNDRDPVNGPKLTGARIMARSMIEYAEEASRDTKRVRRRTPPKEDACDAAYRASLLSGNPLPSTPAEDGLDRA